ncbi:MAG: hypothetical protein HYV08_14165 [Deltaproteobacteria bacterium]|nr:hypothetical protein [Deltaproteobacteria bacterium]MBI3079456.1 hypothetical protein [Deltaproteobacteria bacterium]
MTNTLHRYGTPESFRDDFVVFAISARGRNDRDCAEKLRAFLRLALPHHPVNLGDASKGALLRGSTTMTPVAHWRRVHQPDPEAVIRGLDGPTTAAVVFDNPAALRAFLEDVRQADLGLSVNISGLTEEARQWAAAAGITRHSVEYSLGFHGPLDRLPDRRILEITTMCGHGMLSANFVKKMLDWVTEGRRRPEEAVAYMARFCTCGVFNPARAKRLLEASAGGR